SITTSQDEIKDYLILSGKYALEALEFYQKQESGRNKNWMILLELHKAKCKILLAKILFFQIEFKFIQVTDNIDKIEKYCKEITSNQYLKIFLSLNSKAKNLLGFIENFRGFEDINKIYHSISFAREALIDS